MGRLIELDVDKLKELLNENKIELTNNIISIVRENYIPKADYETRLKNDLAAMLTEIQLEIEEIEVAKENTEIKAGECCMKGACIDLIQQKIDKLRGNENGNDER